MRLFCLTFLVAVLVGCQPTPKSLSEYPEINAVFTDEEMGELQTIRTFFVATACKAEGMAENDPGACIDAYFKRVNETAEVEGYFDLKISDQEELYDELSDELMEEIWYYGMTINAAKDTTASLDLRRDGKYVALLKEMGKEYPSVGKYAERIEVVAALPINGLHGLVADDQMQLFEDERFQLIAAIHYLTLNEQYLAEQRLN